MAKGSRGGKRSGGGSATGELVLPDGSKIEFDGTIEYDGNDKTLTGQARKSVESWEAKRANMKVEYGYAVDANGNPIGNEIRGGKGSVRVPITYHENSQAFTHIHPRGDGMLGGTFSSADLRNFANRKNTTVRAVAKEGTYSISKTSNFNATEFNKFANSADATFNRNLLATSRKLQKDYYDKKISYDDYKLQSAKAFNTELVNLHNTYRSNQKKYGYTYTLEKRS